MVYHCYFIIIIIRNRDNGDGDAILSIHKYI